MWARLSGWEGPAGVDESSEPNNRLSLSVNNDINISTRDQIELSFSVPSDGFTIIDAYNVAGAKIASVYSGNLQAGPHRCHWNRNGISGVIIIKLKHSSGEASVKLNCI